MTDKKEQTKAGEAELKEEELNEAQGGGVIFLPIGDKKPGKGKKVGPTSTTKMMGTSSANPDGN